MGRRGRLPRPSRGRKRRIRIAKYRDFSVPLKAMAAEPSGHGKILREFVQAIRSGGKRLPETICTDNVKSFAMVMAAIQSARSGRKAKVSW